MLAIYYENISISVCHHKGIIHQRKVVKSEQHTPKREVDQVVDQFPSAIWVSGPVRQLSEVDISYHIVNRILRPIS